MVFPLTISLIAILWWARGSQPWLAVEIRFVAGERELAIRNLDRESSLLRNIRGALARLADIGDHGLVVAISQSGETADTLAALQHACARGHRHSLAICNVPESALMRASASATGASCDRG